MLFEAASGESSVTDFLLSHELQGFLQELTDIYLQYYLQHTKHTALSCASSCVLYVFCVFVYAALR